MMKSILTPPIPNDASPPQIARWFLGTPDIISVLLFLQCAFLPGAAMLASKNLSEANTRQVKHALSYSAKASELQILEAIRASEPELDSARQVVASERAKLQEAIEHKNLAEIYTAFTMSGVVGLGGFITFIIGYALVDRRRRQNLNGTLELPE